MSKKNKKKTDQKVQIERCSVNGVSNPRKISSISWFMSIADCEGGYVNMNFAPDGTPLIYAIFPNVSQAEVEQFYREALKIYFTPVDGGKYNALLLRGAVECDVITDPNIYTDNRLEMLRNQPMGVMFLMDSVKNIICGIKAINLSETVRNSIADNAKSMKEQGVTTYQIRRALQKDILPYPPERLEAKATLLGQEKGITTRNLYTSN